MPTCEEREIQIERQAHGALAPAEAVELSAHLATCVSCAAFAALVKRVEGQLAHRAAEVCASVAWSDCERRVHRDARAMQALPWTLAALCIGVPGAFAVNVGVQVARGWPSEGMALVTALTALFFAWVFAAGWKIRARWLSRYERARASREDLFSMAREELAEDRRSSRQAAVTVLVVAAALVGLRAFGPTMTGMGPTLVMIGAALLVACGTYLLLARVREIDRQLRELL